MPIKETVKQIVRKNEEKWIGPAILRNNLHAPPDFMIIGAGKSGTTSLFQYLAQHPQVVPAKKKEVNYFSFKQNRGLRWYLKQFPKKENCEEKLTFDASPSYLFVAGAPKRISQLFPKIKLIAILRDPVNRAFSDWNFFQPHSNVNRRYLLDDRNFDEAVSREIRDRDSVRFEHRYLSRGLYAEQLKRWYTFFNPGQILLLDFETLKRSPKTVLEKITYFLTLENIYDEFTRSGKKEFKGVLKQIDKNKDHKIKAYNANKYKEELNPETEEDLRDYFKLPDEELKSLTGKTFSWMK